MSHRLIPETEFHAHARSPASLAPLQPSAFSYCVQSCCGALVVVSSCPAVHATSADTSTIRSPILKSGCSLQKKEHRNKAKNRKESVRSEPSSIQGACDGRRRPSLRDARGMIACTYGSCQTVTPWMIVIRYTTLLSFPFTNIILHAVILWANKDEFTD